MADKTWNARAAAFFTDFKQKAAASAHKEMQIELAEVQRRTPVLTGALRASEMLEEPKITDKTISITMVAGGPTAPYAIAVHENLDTFHRNGQAKFMESALNESAPHLMARIGRRLKL